MYQWLPGWNYKNLASNGGYFQLSARLALFTGNETYAKKAEELFDWLENTSPLVTKDYVVYDGASTDLNCTKADQNQWTYNYGIMIGGAAYVSFIVFRITNVAYAEMTRCTTTPTVPKFGGNV